MEREIYEAKCEDDADEIHRKLPPGWAGRVRVCSQSYESYQKSEEGLVKAREGRFSELTTEQLLSVNPHCHHVETRADYIAHICVAMKLAVPPNESGPGTVQTVETAYREGRLQTLTVRVLRNYFDIRHKGIRQHGGKKALTKDTYVHFVEVLINKEGYIYPPPAPPRIILTLIGK